jgi:hypothetical protein
MILVSLLYFYVFFHWFFFVTGMYSVLILFFCLKDKNIVNNTSIIIFVVGIKNVIKPLELFS